MNLTLGGVQLNGANKLIIQTEFDLDATVLATEVQICDWLSSTSVDYVADSECTGGGWRTLNTQERLTSTCCTYKYHRVAFQWHIYNGYWSTGTTGGTAVNTPLVNFVNGSNEIKSDITPPPTPPHKSLSITSVCIQLWIQSIKQMDFKN
jgi:hypothetical protein